MEVEEVVLGEAGQREAELAGGGDGGLDLRQGDVEERDLLVCVFVCDCVRGEWCFGLGRCGRFMFRYICMLLLVCVQVRASEAMPHG